MKKKLFAFATAMLMLIACLFVFAGCQSETTPSQNTADTVEEYRFHAFVKMGKTGEIVDGKLQTKWVEKERADLGEEYTYFVKYGLGKKTLVCQENLVVLTLRADNTCLLIDPLFCGMFQEGGLYGTWNMQGDTLTATENQKVYTFQKSGDVLSLAYYDDASSNGECTKIELKKHTVEEKAEYKALAGAYKFSSVTSTYISATTGEEAKVITVNAGQTVEGLTYTQRYFVIFVNADGRFYVLANKEFGVRDGDFGTWSRDGDVMKACLKGKEEYLVPFIVSENTLTLTITQENSDSSYSQIISVYTLKK